MKRCTFNVGLPVFVLWEDTSAKPGWYYTRVLPITGSVSTPMRIATQGFIVASNKDGLTLSHSISREKNGRWGIMDLMTIPWGAIKKVRKAFSEEAILVPNTTIIPSPPRGRRRK